MNTLLTDIRDRLLANDEDWLHEQLIDWSHKGNYSILNYNQFGPVNQHNVLCRGLVFDKQGKIVSFPFQRFFNLGQAEAAPVDIGNADVLEKLDGSLVCTFWPSQENLVFQTRRMLSTHSPDMNMRIKGFGMQQEAKFMVEIGKLVNSIRFFDGCERYVFMFEAVTPMTRIVTEYPPHRHGLYLIGMRDMSTLTELAEDELDEWADVIKIPRPQRWSTAQSEQEIVEMMEAYPSDFEGFVLRDRLTGDRVKIKKKSYMERHYLLSNLNYKKLLPLYFKGERGEIQSYFPVAVSIFDKIESSCQKLRQSVLADVACWQAKELTRKDLALAIVNNLSKDRCHFLFRMIDVPLEKVEEEVLAYVKDATEKEMIDTVTRWLQLDADEELVSLPKEL